MERMQQASWFYRCAEAVCWCSVGAAWERMQGASWCYRGAEVVRWWLWVQGNGCRVPAGAIGVLKLCAGGCGCMGTDAGCQLVLSMR